MATEVKILVSYDGEIFYGQQGIDYRGGRSKFIRLGEPFNYRLLVRAVSRKMGLRENERITRLIYRMPVWSNNAVQFAPMDVTDDEDVTAMVESLVDVQGLKYLQVYVEKRTHEADTDNQPAFNHESNFEMDAMAISPYVQQEHIGMTFNFDELGTSNFSQEIENMGNRAGTSGQIGLQFDLNIASECFDDYVDNNYANVDNEQVDPYIEHGSHVDDADTEIEVPMGCDNLETDRSDEESTDELREEDDEEDQIPLTTYDQGWNVVTNERVEDLDFNLNENMIWESKEALISDIKKYSLKVACEYVVVESRPSTLSVACKNADAGCTWRLRASQKKKLAYRWGISKYTYPHTCTAARLSQDHRQLDSNFICEYILNRVKNHPGIPIISIVGEIHDNLKYIPSYKKAWEGKQKAIAKIWGDWHESYNRLPKWFAAVKAKNPGTIVEWQYRDDYYSPTMSLGQGTKIFRRVFWAFKPCIEAFKGCIPVLQVDGTFLYGKYKHTLMMATAIDGNNAIIPIAFALVESENTSSWPWFMYQIRRHVTDRNGICVISDRHQGILRAMDDRYGWGEGSGSAYHRYCLRHVASNYNTHFKNIAIKNLMKIAGLEAQPRKLHCHLQRIRHVHPDSGKWIDDLPLEKWTLAHDGGHRYGHMTTNIAECVNKVFKKVRHLPVAALVHETFDKMRKYFDERRNKCRSEMAKGNNYSNIVMQSLSKREAKARRHHVSVYDRMTGECEVTTGYDSARRKGNTVQVVKLEAWTCSCGKFQALKYPCSHATACCMALGIDYMAYVDSHYHMEHTLLCYNHNFFPVGHEAYWPEAEDPDVRLLFPDPNTHRRRGQPAGRRRNEMDWHEIGGSGSVQTCSLCKQSGHNRRKCSVVDRATNTSSGL